MRSFLYYSCHFSVGISKAKSYQHTHTLYYNYSPFNMRKQQLGDMERLIQPQNYQKLNASLLTMNLPHVTAWPHQTLTYQQMSPSPYSRPPSLIPSAFCPLLLSPTQTSQYPLPPHQLGSHTELDPSSSIPVSLISIWVARLLPQTSRVHSWFQSLDPTFCSQHPSNKAARLPWVFRPHFPPLQRAH